MTATTSAALASALPSGVHRLMPRAPDALTTRFIDFWLLGGASLVVWLAMITVVAFKANPVVNQHFTNLTATAASLSLLVNYPHFVVSYKLAYTRGRPFIVEHWVQLVAVPIALAVFFALAYFFFDRPVESMSVVSSASATLSTWGANAQVLAGPRLGDLLFTAAFNFMILTIGWHYTKQVYGCMMVYAHFDGYALTKAQRALTKWALFSVWAMSFVDNNIGGTFRVFGTFSYSTLDLPDIAGSMSQLVVGGGFFLVLYKVFYANYRATGQRPSLNLLVPLIALYVWWLPQTREDDFYFLLTPLFHSLQYLAFVYRMEDTRLGSVRHREARATAIIVGVVIAGWLTFELVPSAIDSQLGTFDAWGILFFVTAAMLFVNIHHYFIDNVLWRFKDPRVRAYLLG